MERTVIEALRLGIVPHGHIRDFIFGRENEIEKINDLLSGSSASLMIVGEYGAGKTHLLDYTYNLAIESGFAVARTEVDPSENPFHRPKKVYRELISSFRYMDANGQIRAFRDFMKELSTWRNFKARWELSDTHKYLGYILEELKENRIYDSDWEWIEGNESAVKPTLYDNAPAANIYCNILTGLGWAAAHTSALKGLLLIIDEAETLSSRLTNALQRENGHNFVEGLLFAVNSTQDLLTEGLTRYKGQYQSRIYGDRTGLRYSGHAQDVRYLYKRPSFTKLIMAFTPVPELDERRLRVWQLINAQPSMNIYPLDLAALNDALRYVCRLYEKAYGFTISSEFQSPATRCLLEQMFGLRLLRHPLSLARITGMIANHDDLGSNTRRFIKASVEVLDILRFSQS